MAITFVTGAPGGGKSYLCVSTILKRYYQWNKEEGSYQKKQNLTLITNIEGLMLDHLELEDEIDRCLRLQVEKNFLENSLATEEIKEDYFYSLKAEKLKYFFSYEYQSALQARHGSIIYIIDECQEYFDSKFGRNRWAREVFLFFEKHRHLGIDIYLITQAAGKIHGEIRCLAEKEIRALPRSLSVAGELKYNEYIRGMKANGVPKVVKPKKEVFALYKSMEALETEKISSPLRRIAIGGAVALCVGIAALYFKFYRRPEYVEATTAHQEQVETVSVSEPAGSRSSRTIKASPEGEHWVEVSWLMVDGKAQIVHPISGRLMPLNAKVGMPVALEGRTLLACLSNSDYQVYQVQRSEKSTRLAPERGIFSDREANTTELLDN